MAEIGSIGGSDGSNVGNSGNGGDKRNECGLVSFDTAKTVLVPAELYEGGSAEGYLNFNGMALASGEVAVVSRPVEGVVAVMGIPAGEWDIHKDGYERGGVDVTSPLLCAVAGFGADSASESARGSGRELPQRGSSWGSDHGSGHGSRHGAARRRGREVNIVLTAENVYLAVWDDRLRMAEVLPDNSTDSILYYMQVVGRRFKLRKFDIGVSGERAGLVADALRQYFGNVRVVR